MIKTQLPQQAQPTHQPTQQQPQHFMKRIGTTNYKVAVHFSNTSKESIGDKILRMAKNDVAELAEIPTAERVVVQ